MYCRENVSDTVKRILNKRYEDITFQNFQLYKQYIMCEIIYYILLHKLKDLKPLYNINETLKIINLEDFSSEIVMNDSLFKLLKDSEGIGDSYNTWTLNQILNLFENKIKNYIEFKNKIYTILEKKDNIRKLLNLEVIPPIYEGGNSNIDKVKNINMKEILGKERCIYKKPGDRKEYLKHKGELITIKDYKKLMKDKK